MRKLLICCLFGLALAKPQGYYHQQYQYHQSSSSYKNDELAHKNDAEGFYSKTGDLDGSVKPKVNSYNQESEYRNPKFQNERQPLDFNQPISPFNQQLTNPFGSSFLDINQNSQRMMQHGQSLNQAESAFASGARRQESSYGGSYLAGSQNYGGNYGSGWNYQPTTSYGQGQLSHLTGQLQNDLSRQLQEAIRKHYMQSSSYSQSSSSSSSHQMNADLQELQRELKQNLTNRLQEALGKQYGKQVQEGSYSYSVVTGSPHNPVANYNNQELNNLTQQIEENLLRELQTGVTSHYSQVPYTPQTPHQQPGATSHYPQVPYTPQKPNQQTGATSHYPQVPYTPQTSHQQTGGNYGSLETLEQRRPDYLHSDQRDNRRPIQNTNSFHETQQGHSSYNQQQHSQQETYQHKQENQNQDSTYRTYQAPVVPLSDVMVNLQNELFRQVTQALSEEQRKYSEQSSTHYYIPTYETQYELLSQQLKQNFSQLLETELRKNYGQQQQRDSQFYTILSTGSSNSAPNYRISDLDNYKQQIESNLLRQLQTGLQQQRTYYTQRSSSSSSTQYSSQSAPTIVRPTYQNQGSTNQQQTDSYASSNELKRSLLSPGSQTSQDRSYSLTSFNRNSGYEYVPGRTNYDSQLVNYKNQVESDLTRQLQNALTAQQYQSYSSHSSSASGARDSRNNYQHTLQDLTEQLRRNLSSKVEETLNKHYANQGQKGEYTYTILTSGNPSATYSSQQINDLTNQMQNDLLRQLEEGLARQQSSYSSYSGYSSSGSTNHGQRSLGQYGSGMSHQHNTRSSSQTGILPEDCDMQADDSKAGYPQTTEKRNFNEQQVTADELINSLREMQERLKKLNLEITQHKQFEDLTQRRPESDDLQQQQTEDLTQYQQHEDLTQQQQSEDLTQQQQTEDLTQYQQIRDLTQQVEKFSQHNQRNYDKLQFGNQQQDEKLTEDLTQQQTEDLTQQQQTEDLTQQQQTEDLTQQQQTEDLTQYQQIRDLTQQVEKFSQHNQRNYDKLQFGNQQQEEKLTQQHLEDLTQQQQTEDLIQQQQTEDLTQQQQTEDLTQQQQTQGSTQQVETFHPYNRRNYDKLQFGNQQQQDEDLTQQQNQDLTRPQNELTQQQNEHDQGTLQFGDQQEQDLTQQQQTETFAPSYGPNRGKLELDEQKQYEKRLTQLQEDFTQQNLETLNQQQNQDLTQQQNGDLTQQQEQIISQLQFGDQQDQDTTQQQLFAQSSESNSGKFELNQHTQETETFAPSSGPRRDKLELDQEQDLTQQLNADDDLTQQQQQIFSKPAGRTNNQLQFGDHTLTQQQQNDDLVQQQGNDDLVQQQQNDDLVQQQNDDLLQQQNDDLVQQTQKFTQQKQNKNDEETLQFGEQQTDDLTQQENYQQQDQDNWNQVQTREGGQGRWLTQQTQSQKLEFENQDDDLTQQQQVDSFGQKDKNNFVQSQPEQKYNGNQHLEVEQLTREEINRFLEKQRYDQQQSQNKQPIEPTESDSRGRGDIPYGQQTHENTEQIVDIQHFPEEDQQDLTQQNYDFESRQPAQTPTLQISGYRRQQSSYQAANSYSHDSISQTYWQNQNGDSVASNKTTSQLNYGQQEAINDTFESVEAFTEQQIVPQVAYEVQDVSHQVDQQENHGAGRSLYKGSNPVVQTHENIENSSPSTEEPTTEKPSFWKNVGSKLGQTYSDAKDSAKTWAEKLKNKIG